MRWLRSVITVLLLLMCCGSGQLEDPRRTLIEAANKRAPSPGEMPLEACVIGMPLATLKNHILVTIENGLERDGITIEYIRRHDARLSHIRDAKFLLKGGVFLVEAGVNVATNTPITLVREGLVRARWHFRDQRASVLKPGESCDMWLPAENEFHSGDWQIISSRVPIRREPEGPQVMTTNDLCLNALTGKWQACTLRLDLVDYASPGQWSNKCRMRVSGGCRYKETSHWEPWKRERR